MSSIEPINEEILALIDCNNFYVSCERVFNPRLIGVPVAILSSNDGCIVARSKELKMLGVPMGAPMFLYKELFARHSVRTLSSNYCLYGDMSNRVMQCIKRHAIDMEIYSVDEAFLTIPKHDWENAVNIIRAETLQWTGIPVSIGVAKTKTLAKLANSYAKEAIEGYFGLSEKTAIEERLSSTSVGEIWGIGRKTTEGLKKEGIYTAKQLIDKPDSWIRKHFGVGLLRTAWELKNTPAISLDDLPPAKKSIICSRSFGDPLTLFDDVAEALSGFTARAAEKAREQESFASYLEVFLTTSPFNKEIPCYANSQFIALPEPTSHTPTLIHFAKLALKAIFKEGLPYKKTGVTLGGLVSEKGVQLSLFQHENSLKQPQKNLMGLIDRLNHKFGRKTVFFAAEGTALTGNSRPKCENRSSSYTTRWDELLTVKI